MARDPRQARFISWSSLRWVIRHRAWSWWYLVRYARLARLRLRHPQVILRGMVFLGRNVQIEARRGYGRIIIGRWVHLGDGTRLRCHEGCLTVGDKVVMGQQNTINGYLDIEIGGSTLIADWVYVCDFDHVTEDIHQPIKDQGIVKSPVRIGPDTWIGVKATVLRGSIIGRGAVIAAHAVVHGEIPDFAIAAGIPAKPVKDRRATYEANAARRAALADIERKTQHALAQIVDQRVDELGRA